MSPAKERPAPLVTSDVDISSLSYMPVFVARLRGSKSWLISRRRPELFRPMFAMWMRAYQERPAGSLEADDDVLADAAELGFEAWVDLKTDLLRGWILCSDGRYYHPVLAELVLQAFERTVLPNKLRTAAATEARLKKHRSRHGTSNATAHVTSSSRDGNPDVTSTKEGKKERSKEEHPPKSRAARTNGHQHPRDAMLEVATGLRTGKPPADPISARIIESLGGFDHLAAKTEAGRADALREFESLYSAAVQH